MHATNKEKVITRDAGRSTPNERWQSQRKTAWAKLGRSETPDRQGEDFAGQFEVQMAQIVGS
jgi:hypothetical protein